jgi:hypothetical protein
MLLGIPALMSSTLAVPSMDGFRTAYNSLMATWCAANNVFYLDLDTSTLG